MLCNFCLKSYLWFQTKLPPRLRSILKSRVWFLTKLHPTQYLSLFVCIQNHVSYRWFLHLTLCLFLKALRCLDIDEGLFSQKQKHVPNSSQFDWTSLVNKACIILWLKYFFWYKQVMLWGQDNRIRFILPVCGACNVIITSWDTF